MRAPALPRQDLADHREHRLVALGFQGHLSAAIPAELDRGPTPIQVWMRRAVYRAWRALPLPVQRLILHVALPRVSLGTCAVIFDAAGRLLVVRHSYRRQPWGLPGGFVRRGEQPAAALERELQEELGVEVTVSRLLFTEKDELDRHLTVYYQARVLGAVCPNDAELDGYRYVSLRELPALFPVVPPSWVRGMEEAMAA